MGKGLGMSRIHRYLGPVLGGLAALILTGCSGNNGGPANAPTLYLQIFDAGKESIAAKTEPKTERPPLTRAALDAVKGSFLEVTLERPDLLAYLYVNLERHDDSPGKITLWRTEDNVTVAMRNGVLIGTRGLGGDIASAKVQVRGDAPGPASGGERVLYIQSRDNKETRLSLVCDLVDLGPDPVVIIELKHQARHLQERCEGAGGTVVNDYWVDSAAGLIWQSRQWAGPHIGYMRTRRLTN